MKMAATQSHFRSISLPSRLHPINSTEFAGEVAKLKANQTSSLQSSLVGLAELYNSIEELTQSPSTRRSLQESSFVQDALEGSVELLDSCSAIRELAEMMRENVRSLQSALRRKGLDCSVQNGVALYVGARKKMNKCIKKSLKTLKNLEAKVNSSSSDGEGQERSFGALREVYGLTISIFKCAMMFFSTSSSDVKSGGWNLVSRLMINKSAVVSEVGCVDFAVSNLHGSVRSGDREMVQRSLRNLESCMEGVEVGLERMFRQLLQNRVNLLNIFTNH